MQRSKKKYQPQYDLFIDTTNNYCYLAIYTNSKKVIDVKLKVNKNVTDLITDSIKSLFAKAKLSYECICKIYLNVGPGSFTGIKVGVVIAKTWGCVYKPTIYVIDSLCLQTNHENSISLLDAKGQLFYVAIYSGDNVVLKPSLKTKKQVSQLLNKYPKYHKCINQIDKAYGFFLAHKKHFKKIPLTKLEPLYLKTPFKKIKK